ncbi:Spore coat protein SA [Limihaloglobus sulfuriphilus]|uniref:Spore coat protein SA n=1 Tax=Limihaloglobus sulfuriphilus TaxID=1851148 RepID=A0A1Q2MF39_9BACT|nr:glycosyltransferase family 4 protein [Limihaloglobus sulfuriphilus]AQQ71316.1 Spore coat protein SA [Limihaloglobus sulfuriphilus]
MKIVQLLPELNQGGVERGTVELSRELVKRGHQSIVISAGGKLARQITADGGEHITHDVCSKNPLTALPRILKLKKILRRLSPDIVHARSRVPAWMCVFALKGLDIPFVTTVHGFNSVNCYSRVMLRGERVIYGSTSIKEYVLENYHFDSSKLRYVPRGIDMEYFDPAKLNHKFIDSFKEEHSLNGRYIISIVGRITGWKGHPDFIQAVGRIHQENPNVLGLIVGRTADNKTEYYDQLKQQAAAFGDDAFCFTGPQSQVREIYSLSNIVISAASTKPETFGRIAAEAMSMNTPVVASSHGGSLDIIKEPEAGMFYPPGNSDQLYKKIKLAMNHKFGDMRKHINDHFSLDIMVEKELAVYKELLG